MAVYFVTGKLGAGKGLFCDYMMSQYYKAGLRIAANYPVDTSLLSRKSDKPVFVLPPQPRISDFELLGRGCPDTEFERFGAVFLDEAGTWLNTTVRKSPDFPDLLDWFIHSRKKGWDVYVVVQDESLINKQIYSATGENLVVVERKDRIRVPFVSDILEIIFPDRYGVTGKSKGLLPHLVSYKTYIGKISYKSKPNERGLFFARQFFGVHPTNFQFSDSVEYFRVPVSSDYPDGVKSVYMGASYNLLPGKTIEKMRRVNDIKSKIEEMDKEGKFMNVNNDDIIKDVVNEMDNKNKTKIKKKRFFIFVLLSLLFYFWIKSAVFLYNKYFENEDKTHITDPIDYNLKNDFNIIDFNVRNKNDFKISKNWRLSGYFNSDGKNYFILVDNSDNVRYFYSEDLWDGVFTSIVVDNELVNFYSGSKSTESNSGSFISVSNLNGDR